MSESLPPEKNARDRAFGIACWTLGALAFVLLLMVGVSFSLTARTVVVEKVVETPVPVPVQQNPEGPAAVEEGDEPDTAGIAAVPAGSSENPVPWRKCSGPPICRIRRATRSLRQWQPQSREGKASPASHSCRLRTRRKPCLP